MMRHFMKNLAGMALFGVAALLMTGCATEKVNPFPVQAIGGTPQILEDMMMDLDARGFINGVFQPFNRKSVDTVHYPVSYTGNWRLIDSDNIGGYMIISNKAGARVDIVASTSRVVFDFWDNEMYANPGTVKFELDGKELGEFDLTKASASRNKIIDYQVTTGKTDISTVSMILSTGTAVITGYLLVFPAN